MNIIDIKQELNSYIYEEKWIKEKEEEIEELQERTTKITTTISDMPKGNNPIADRMAEYVAEIVDLTNEMIEEVHKFKKIQRNIENNINSLKQPYKNILYFRYVKGYNLTEVANKIGFEYKYTCSKHGEALEMYRKIREEEICKKL